MYNSVQVFILLFRGLFRDWNLDSPYGITYTHTLQSQVFVRIEIRFILCIYTSKFIPLLSCTKYTQTILILKCVYFNLDENAFLMKWTPLFFKGHYSRGLTYFNKINLFFKFKLSKLGFLKLGPHFKNAHELTFRYHINKAQ